MAEGTRFAALALGVALLLPAPGTTSRGRAFCEDWLALGAGARQDVLAASEAREGGPAAFRACRARLRPALRHKLDAECRNWKLLMDFEVRVYADGVWEPCGVPPAEG